MDSGFLILQFSSRPVKMEAEGGIIIGGSPVPGWIKV